MDVDFLEHVKTLCHKSTGGLTGELCQNRWAPKVWERNEDGEYLFHWGDAVVCNAPIFLSRETNRDIRCGACEIREIECVEECKKVRRMQITLDSKQIDDHYEYSKKRVADAISALSMMIEMSGCKSGDVYSRAANEMKREAEWRERVRAGK